MMGKEINSTVGMNWKCLSKNLSITLEVLKSWLSLSLVLTLSYPHGPFM